MDLFEFEAVELTGVDKVVVGHDAYKPGYFFYILALGILRKYF